MTRRPPVKITKTPAELSPELDAVRRRDASSLVVQERLRAERFGPDFAKVEPGQADIGKGQGGDANEGAEADPTPLPPQQTDSRKSEPVETVTAEAAPSQGKPAGKTVKPAREKKEPAQVAQRLTVRVILDLETDKAISRVAAKLQQDAHYVEKAVLHSARLSFLKRAADRKLADLASEARLLIAKARDRGTRGVEAKVSVDEGTIALMRDLLNDPLALQTGNSMAAAFIGAEAKEHLKKL